MDNPKEKPLPPPQKAVQLRNTAEQKLAFVRYMAGAEPGDVEREILQLRGETPSVARL